MLAARDDDDDDGENYVEHNEVRGYRRKLVFYKNFFGVYLFMGKIVVHEECVFFSVCFYTHLLVTSARIRM